MSTEEQIKRIDDAVKKIMNHGKWRWIRKIEKFFDGIWDGLVNLAMWLPIVWKDRQFDHAYLYIVLRHKLRLMEKFYSSDKTWCVGTKRHAKEIRIARILCDRLVEDYYPSFKKNDWKHNTMQNKQDRDYLFDLMKKHVDKWWD